MFYCYLFFKIVILNVFFFLRNSVLCIWLSNEGIKHTFYLSLPFWKLNVFGKQREFTIVIKSQFNIELLFQLRELVIKYLICSIKPY